MLDNIINIYINIISSNYARELIMLEAFSELDIKNIVITFILSLIVLILTQYIKQYFKYKEGNKRRYYFINFLRSNKKIDECITDFEKKSELEIHNILIFSSAGFIVGYLLIPILYAILLLFFDDLWLTASYLTLINFVPFVIIIISINSTIKNPFEKTCSFLKTSDLITLFLYSTNSVILLLMYLSYLSSSKIESNLTTIVSLVLISTSLFLAVIYGLINGKKTILDSLKKSLNKKFLKGFPEICIKLRNENVCGIIQNIFDNNLIVLYNKGHRIAIEWDNIILINLKESKTIQSELIVDVM